jgi:hypothetical protein
MLPRQHDSCLGKTIWLLFDRAVAESGDIVKWNGYDELLEKRRSGDREAGGGDRAKVALNPASML